MDVVFTSHMYSQDSVLQEHTKNEELFGKYVDNEQPSAQLL